MQRQHCLEGFGLNDYIDESIKFLRLYEPPDGYFVGFSGGKDSIVSLELCRMAEVKHGAYYTYTTIDPPEVVSFIREHYPQVHWLRPAKSFFALLGINAPPLRMQRWCCHEIKEKPSWGVPLQSRVFGIRAEESRNRAERGKINVRVIRKGRGKAQNGRLVHTHYHPIFNWPEWAVWEFIEIHGLPYPSLYDEGFQRIGCICCPYSFGKSPGAVSQRAISMQRWPGTWKAFEHAVKRWFKRKKESGGYKNETEKEYWESYLNGFE